MRAMNSSFILDFLHVLCAFCLLTVRNFWDSLEDKMLQSYEIYLFY